MRRTTALIFDLDGTVLNNERQWGKAFGVVLNQLGVKNVEEYPHVSGIGVKENWPIFLDKFDIKTDFKVEELEHKTREQYKNFTDEVEIQPGFERFMGSAREMGYITALATSNIWLAVEDVFERFDIADNFDVITTGEEVEEKKPNPSIFLITAQKIGVDPSECVVFEDSPSGIEAALLAKMNAVAIARSEEIKKQLKMSEDVLVIEDFTEISIDELPEIEQVV